jgi:hypothetical protein
LFGVSYDTTIASSRFISKPIVNTIVNNLAFNPPERTPKQFLKLLDSKDNFCATDGKYNISYIITKPNKSYVNSKYTQNTCILLSHGNGTSIFAEANI